jgi:hypothetical protein
MLEKIDCILLFNGLSALIVSAVGVEVLICISQYTGIQENINQENESLKQDTTKRIFRWRCVFNKFCVLLLEEHSITYAYERKATGEKSNPFEQHVQLLIEATRLLIQNHNDQDLGSFTLKEIQAWFYYIDCLKGTYLWKQFTKENCVLLTDLHDEFDQNKKCGTGGKEYPHFNAAALLIRCSYIIHIQRDHFLWELLKEWEVASGLFLSKFVLKQNDYFTNKTQQVIVKDSLFPYFPYIGSLPYTALHEKIGTCAPLAVHEFFEEMSECLKGQMMTISATNSYCSTSNNDNKTNIQRYLTYLETITRQLMLDMNKIKTCEKQRRYHIKNSPKKRKTQHTKPWLNVCLFCDIQVHAGSDDEPLDLLNNEQQNKEDFCDDEVKRVSNNNMLPTSRAKISLEQNPSPHAGNDRQGGQGEKGVTQTMKSWSWMSSFKRIKSWSLMSSRFLFEKEKNPWKGKFLSCTANHYYIMALFLL